MPKYIAVYSRNKFPKIKDEAYVINLEQYESIGTDWITMYMNGYNAIYVNSSGAEYIPK